MSPIQKRKLLHKWVPFCDDPRCKFSSYCTTSKLATRSESKAAPLAPVVKASGTVEIWCQAFKKKEREETDHDNRGL